MIFACPADTLKCLLEQATKQKYMVTCLLASVRHAIRGLMQSDTCMSRNNYQCMHGELKRFKYMGFNKVYVRQLRSVNIVSTQQQEINYIGVLK